MLAYVTNTMVVHPSVPAKTVAEFIAYAKANPGKIDVRVGRHRLDQSSVRRAVREDDRRQDGARALSRRRAGDRSTRSAGARQIFFTAGTQSLPHVKAGKLRLLAVTEGKRSRLLA